MGDVFLHLLPEASVQLSKLGYSTLEAQQYLGVWILFGLILFVVFETVFVQLHNVNASLKESVKEPEVDNHHSNGTTNGLKHRKPNGVVVKNGMFFFLL